MRVLAISPTGVLSGAERVLLRYARAATERGWTFRIAAPEGPFAEAIVRAEIPYLAISELKLGEGPRATAAVALAGRNLSTARTLRRANSDADVVVLNSVMALPTSALLRPRTPTALLVHDVITRGDLQRITKLFARTIDLAIGVSEVSAAPFRALGRRTIVVSNGVPWPVEPSRPSPGTVVGLSAVQTHWKGQHVFLDAIARLDQCVTGVLLGKPMPKDAAYAASLHERARASDLRDRIHFHGHSDNPLEVMRDWTVAVSASVEPEAGPLVVLEAMSLGLPVVVTDHGGAAEFARGVGILVAPNDADALAAGISQYLGSPELRATAGEAGVQRIADRYTLDAAIDGFLTAIAELGGHR